MTEDPSNNGDELLTVQQVAKIFKVDPSSVHRWAKRGDIEVVSLPHTGNRERYRIWRSTLNALLTPVRKGQQGETH